MADRIDSMPEFDRLSHKPVLIPTDHSNI